MNVYAFEFDGETDWVCANTMIQAIKFYDSHFIPLHDLDDSNDVILLTDEQLDTSRVVYPDGEPDEDGSYRTETFREAIKGMIEPAIIASTAY